MNKPLRILILIIIILFILAVMVYTVWGQTIKTAVANDRFSIGEYEPAAAIYEDLMVDLPSSLNLKHNLALCYYQEDRYQKAIALLEKPLRKIKPTPGNAAVYYFDLGNILYKNALRNSADVEQALKYFTMAVECYKKSLLADPADQAAKYNYELAVLHMKQLQNQPRSEQTPQQEIENMLKNTANTEQLKAKLIHDNTPPNVKDW